MRPLIVALLLVFSSGTLHAQEMKMAVTTSFHNSGLSDILLPEIKKDIGLDVLLIVVGTGQALRLGRAGDVDAILMQYNSAEEKIVDEGFGTQRREIMYNDFVFVGPKDDPAMVAAAEDAIGAMNAISKEQSVFVSRGDDSGTHKKELSLWQLTDLQPETFSPKWYRSVGSGMGATLNTASGLNAYVMSDRASWLKFKNKGDLELLFASDPALFNQYAFLPVNPRKHTHVKNDLALSWEAWLTSEKGQAMIGAYTVNGERLFTPNAQRK